MSIFTKDAYAIQPYKVGSKSGQSLALIFPAEAVRACNITPSSIFVVRLFDENRRIALEMLPQSGVAA